MIQLSVNLTMIVVSGLLTLFIQRQIYLSRREKHRDETSSRAANPPLGQSRDGTGAGRSADQEMGR